ncbi:hypothetical protein GE061_012804 [Apolygus lucorum]|uniref:Uncharacterized protein n=1 Tax=Apolygus lucorum TaxID=248454 RepID=A0A8S9XTB8_APOLU|nr:hypothetical protein GE061_012804 [Apolygus lucorum]
MEYQHCTPRGTTVTKREEEDEPFTVGTVTVSERRKPVVINNESCATATLTAFPSTSPGTTAVPLNPFSVNEVGNNQPEVVTVPTTPATPVETSLPEQADGNTATPATLAASEFSEQSLATPAAPAQQTAKLPNEVGTTAQRSAVVDDGLPAVPTATPVATTTVEVAVAAPAMPDMLTATIQDHSMTFTEPAVADVAAPEMMTTRQEESVTPLEDELNDDDQLDVSELFPRKDTSYATPPAQSSDPVTGTGVPGDVSCEEDEDFVDALAHQPQEPRTVPVPIKEEPDDATTASTPDQEQEEPGHPYKLRQREPVNYRKLHMGAITQATTDLLTNSEKLTTTN